MSNPTYFNHRASVRAVRLKATETMCPSSPRLTREYRADGAARQLRSDAKALSILLIARSLANWRSSLEWLGTADLQ